MTHANAADRRVVRVYARCRALRRGTTEGVAVSESGYFLRVRRTSAALFTRRILERVFPVDVPLLKDRKTRVRHPVEHQSRGEQREHDREYDGHQLEDSGLHRIR